MSAVRVRPSSRQIARRTILWAGLVAGTLDITAAFLIYARSVPAAIALLHGIASGLMGKAAMNGGIATALLGLLCHFFIATSWAAIYYAASRRLHFLLEHEILSGIAYGLIVYAVMNFIVIPLSAIGPRPFVLAGAARGATILVVCIGLPIATIVHKFAAIDSGVPSA